jgi:hypothetical protein
MTKLLLLGKGNGNQKDALVAFRQQAQVLKPTANSDGIARRLPQGIRLLVISSSPTLGRA